jgi:uncharacterized membrane protein YdfJ with MMPL/SSD domain
MRRAAAVLILGVVIALTAQFALDGWAAQSDLNHWVQHGLLFWSGVAVGCAVINLYLAGRRR